VPVFDVLFDLGELVHQGGHLIPVTERSPWDTVLNPGLNRSAGALLQICEKRVDPMTNG
jgi:hypothetical protein